MNRRNPFPLYSEDWERFEEQREAYIEAQQEEYKIRQYFKSLKHKES